MIRSRRDVPPPHPRPLLASSSSGRSRHGRRWRRERRPHPPGARSNPDLGSAIAGRQVARAILRRTGGNTGRCEGPCGAWLRVCISPYSLCLSLSPIDLFFIARAASGPSMLDCSTISTRYDTIKYSIERHLGPSPWHSRQNKIFIPK